MKISKKLAVLAVGILALAGVGIAATSASATNANHPSTYEGGEHQAVCYKHDGNSDHASLTEDGKGVVLKPFNQAWQGDHWETLVVKGGDGRNIISHPTAGTTYSAPLNNGGNTPDVSHYIVCKGTTPQSEPEPSVTPEPEEPAPYNISTSHVQACGTATITLVNNSPWIYPVSFIVDGGEMQYGATVDNRGNTDLNPTGTNSKTFTFEEDSGTHTIAYRVQAGTESDLYNGLPVGEWTTLTIESDCVTPDPEITPSPTPDPDPSITPDPTPTPDVTPDPEPTPVVTPDPEPEPVDPEPAPKPAEPKTAPPAVAVPAKATFTG
jgi:hypothetical protein